ncbi:hypothetical protein PBI_ELVA_11 [Microbacterium phage Elva]|uniref:hypothetical protein n=1 Tax=Microbacterium phage Elva TaxID=2126929 RepID=UPI000D1FE255|nr:hypothetical protein QDW20_gp11 [Microbacterium phage Elva]AVR56754.1 hypothetical protein PBI_ELVA_11 [Microbacterium phage Elva]
MVAARTIKMNPKGIVELLKSAEVQRDLEDRGTRIHAALPTDKGEEWRLSSFMGHDRAQVVVGTGNAASRRKQAEDNDLIRALDRGR